MASFAQKLTGNWSWRGGSARAAVRGYITRQGKRVKAHSRAVAGRQAAKMGTSIVGPAAFRVLTSKADWKQKTVGLIIVALGGTPPGTQRKSTAGKTVTTKTTTRKRKR